MAKMLKALNLYVEPALYATLAEEHHSFAPVLVSDLYFEALDPLAVNEATRGINVTLVAEREHGDAATEEQEGVDQMPMKKDRRIEQDLKALKAIKPAELKEKFQTQEKFIREAQASGNAFKFLHALGRLAPPLLVAGQQAIVAGDKSGWNTALEACRATIAVWERARIRSTFTAPAVARALLFSLAAEGWTPAFETILSELEACLAAARPSERKKLQLTYFTVYIAKLMAGKKAKLDGPKSPLSKLAEHIDAELTPKRLNEVCEFQLKNAGFTEDDGTEFIGFEITPLWWFAIARLRSEKGLETPRPEHPLFATPFATLPPKLKFDPNKSALLKRIRAAPPVKD